MTRINANVNPKQLTDQHLLAEIRELARIPNNVKKKIRENKKIDNIPIEFCLGQGHVKFFYNKMEFLKDRYLKLHEEAKNRGFSINYYNDLFDFDFSMYGCCEFTNKNKANSLIKNRIYKRVVESKQQPRYYKENVKKDYYLRKILKAY